MSYRTTVVALTICLFVPGIATAQAPAPAEPESAGFFAIGVSRPESAEMNDALAAAGYPTFDGGALTLGGGGYGVHRGRIMLGGEGYGVIAGEDAVAGRTVTYSGGYGMFNVGYLLRPSPSTRVYPMIGIGGGGTSLRIGARATDESFDNILASPGRTSQLTRGSFLLSFAVGAEYRMNPAEHGLMLGVRAGYMAAPFTSAWRLDESAIERGPDASLAGPFVLFTIGSAGVE